MLLALTSLMPIIVRNRTEEGMCSTSHQPIRRFSGEVELWGGYRPFFCELHKSNSERIVWIAFTTGPWWPTDGRQGTWISVHSTIFDNAIGCVITNALASPLRARDELRGLRALDRAEVFARLEASEYFSYLGDIVLCDRETYEFIVPPPPVAVIGR